MRNLLCSCTLAVLLIGHASAGVTPRPSPIVITLDGHDYVTFEAPELSPSTRLVLAPEARMVNCRRPNGEPLLPGLFRLEHSVAGDKVDSVSMRIEFRPTRLMLATVVGDVICDGEANGGTTGVGRVFRDEFEPESPAPQSL